MANSQNAIKEPIMGRVDVLFRFLQKIGEDRPRDIDKYLKQFHIGSEDRPIVDQIVDLIIAGNKDRYEKYEEARREVSSELLYDEKERSEQAHKKPLSFFLETWIDFEKALRIIATESENEREPFFSLLHKLQNRPIVRDERDDQRPPEQLFTPDEIQTIEGLSKLRNGIVHGVETVNDAEIVKAGRRLQTLLKKLLTTHPVDLRAERSRSIVRKSSF